MDANYVMDETLGTVTYDISKLKVGQIETVPFPIGKVSCDGPRCSPNKRVTACRSVIVTK